METFIQLRVTLGVASSASIIRSYLVGHKDNVVVHEPIPIMLAEEWSTSITYSQITELCKKRPVKNVTNSEEYIYVSWHEVQLPGCQHYQLNCRIICPKCDKAYPCRICHDDSFECEPLDRNTIREVECLSCNKRGTIGSLCVHCGALLAVSFCHKCNYISNFSYEVRPTYHCKECGFCRVGLESSHKHCNKCNQCFKNEFFEEHTCDADNFVCCVCQEPLRTSIKGFTELPCKVRHYIHLSCWDALLHNGDIRCPLCRRATLEGVSLKKHTASLDKSLCAYLLAYGMMTIESETEQRLVLNLNTFLQQEVMEQLCCQCLEKTYFPFLPCVTPCTKCHIYNTDRLDRVVLHPDQNAKYVEAWKKILSEIHLSQDDLAMIKKHVEHITNSRGIILDEIDDEDGDEDDSSDSDDP